MAQHKMQTAESWNEMKWQESVIEKLDINFNIINYMYDK